MSTELTSGESLMVDSLSLKLVFASATVHELVTRYLAQVLTEKGYRAVTPSVLGFIGAMDCGVNYASEIARRLNVSRQMVAKTVKELCKEGYLTQEDGEGRQKKILFTELGGKLIGDSRRELTLLDGYLEASLGKGELAKVLDNLSRIEDSLKDILTS